jgi:hypothetical protein
LKDLESHKHRKYRFFKLSTNIRLVTLSLWHILVKIMVLYINFLSLVLQSLKSWARWQLWKSFETTQFTIKSGKSLSNLIQNYCILKTFNLNYFRSSYFRLKVPKRVIFVTELFTLSDPIWVGDWTKKNILNDHKGTKLVPKSNHHQL